MRRGVGYRVSLKERFAHLEPIMPWIILGRISAGLALAGVWVFWASGIRSVAGSVGAATVLWWVFTLFLVGHGLSGRPFRVTGVLVASALFDAVSLGMLTMALGSYKDPFLAWYVGEAVIIAILLRRKQAWTLISILAGSYILAHTLGPGIDNLLDFAFLSFNVTGLLAVGIAISYTLGDQDERRVEAEARRAEVIDLNTKLERSVAELRAVTEITELIHSTLEVESVGPTLLNILEKVIDIPTAALYVIDKSKQETVFSTSSAAAMGVPRAYTGLELAGEAPTGSSEGALSCIELVDYNQTLVVFCADTTAIDGLTRDDRIVLQAVASELVVAVENSRLYRLTKRLAITDELTDLFNYRFLQQRLDDEIGRAGRYDKRLSLLMLDIDDFKHVNDTYGHMVGDTVLAEVGQVLKTTVREVDVVARYGGEEFTVILPETDASGAFIVAEKIREAISMHRFPDQDDVRAIHITSSIGLASYPVHASDKESLLRAADNAVYRAKETGKDRVRAPRLRLRRLPASADTTEEIAE